MKEKKYKVTLEVNVEKTVYVKAFNKREAEFLAYSWLLEESSKKPTIEGKYIGGKTKKSEIVKPDPGSERFNIFGDDYCS